MQKLFSKNFNNANKALSIIIVFLIGFLSILIYFLAIKLTNNQDIVADDTQKAYAMDYSDDNTGGIPVRNTNNNDWAYDKSCRYVTGGGHCARSEFRSGCNPGPNQICVCGHNNPNDVPKAGGYTYGDTQHRSIDEYTDCGAPNVNERNRVCQALASGQNPGSGYNVEDSGNVWIVRGVAPVCQNPYRFDCPKPTPTPTPMPSTGTLAVEARCVDNSSERVSVWVQIWRNDPYAAFNQGYTRLTLQTVDVAGITYGVTFVDGQTDGTRGFPALKAKYPNARFDGFEVSTGSFTRISANEITGVSFNATVTLNFRGCVAQPTNTPNPSPINPACNNITITNLSKNNATCNSTNPQACNVTRGDNLRVTINGSNGNSYAISQTEYLNNNQPSRSAMSAYQSSNVIQTSVPNDNNVASLEIRGYVRRNDVVAPDNNACRIVFNLPTQPTNTPTPVNPVCNNITITNLSKNNATCTSTNPQACNIARGDNLRVTVNGSNGTSYAISQLTRNNDGTSLSSITPYQSSNQFNTSVTNATNLSRLEIVGYVSDGTRNVTNDSTCRIAFDFAPVNTPTPTPNPSISIRKTLISPNFQPVNSTITFGITVTNNGNVDITDFNLVDEYDPEYLRLERAYVNRQNANENIQPSSTTQINVNGRVRNQVTWTNLPVGSQPLLRGQSYTLYLDFRILREVSANVALENDNCGVVSRITYRSGNQDISNTIQNVRDCAEFNTRTPNPLRAEISKRVLNSPVNIGSELRFEAILTNNDPESRSYDDVDFRDVYDTRYLRPRQVEVFKGDRRALVTNLGNTGTITIDNVQDLVANDNNRLGGLNRGESYRFVIVFEAISAIDSTCDTVSASVRNNSQNVGGNTNEARACGQIIAPRPPKTGVNVFWSLIVPMLNIVGSLFVRDLVLRKFSKN